VRLAYATNETANVGNDWRFSRFQKEVSGAIYYSVPEKTDRNVLWLQQPRCVGAYQPVLQRQ